MDLLRGKVAVITGASKGIGRVMSRHFAREGAQVVCAARSADLVRETVALIAGEGGQALSVTADVSREDDARRLMEAAEQGFGRLDILVNNAGDGGPTKPVQDYTTEEWFDTINSCLTSAYLCVRFAVPAMLRAGGGAIVNISSVAGRRGLAFRIGYSAAKAGQVGLTYAMALELGPHNIRVNAIAPGAVEGDRIDRVLEGRARVLGRPIEALRATVIREAPLQRMSAPEDIARLAAFLASDLARNISGQCIAVTAGVPAV